MLYIAYVHNSVAKQIQVQAINFCLQESKAKKKTFPIAYYLMLTSQPTKLGTTCLRGDGGGGGSTIGDQWFKSCKILYGIILMHVCIVL